MATAVFGRKKQMTQAFQDDGTLVGVTVIEVEPNLITAVRTAEEDGYTAVQVGFGAAKSGRVDKARVGTFAHAPGEEQFAAAQPTAAMELARLISLRLGHLPAAAVALGA